MAKPRKAALLRISTPRNVHRVIPIIKIKERDVLQLVVCSPRVWGHATHWDGSRTVPCLKSSGKCICDGGTVATRDKGYVLAANGVGQVVGFLELTPLAWEDLQAMAVNLDGLRGKIIQVKRQHQSLKGRLLVEDWGWYQGEHPLPKDQDPEPTLRRIYGWEGRD